MKHDWQYFVVNNRFQHIVSEDQGQFLSRWWGGLFRLRNVTIVGFLLFIIIEAATYLGRMTIFRQKYIC
jgi:hypothetical protein